MFFHKFDKDMLSVKEAIEQEKNIQIVDVRFKEEYEEGHIPTAILLPLSEVEEKALSLLKKDVDTYVYCRSGQRSTKAKKILQDLGFQEVYNIGGIIHWEYETEK